LKKKKKKKTIFDPDASGDVESTKDSLATDNMPADDVITEEKSVAQGAVKPLVYVCLECFML